MTTPHRTAKQRESTAHKQTAPQRNANAPHPNGQHPTTLDRKKNKKRTKRKNKRTKESTNEHTNERTNENINQRTTKGINLRSSKLANERTASENMGRKNEKASSPPSPSRDSLGGRHPLLIWPRSRTASAECSRPQSVAYRSITA